MKSLHDQIINNHGWLISRVWDFAKQSYSFQIVGEKMVSVSVVTTTVLFTDLLSSIEERPRNIITKPIKDKIQTHARYEVQKYQEYGIGVGMVVSLFEQFRQCFTDLIKKVETDGAVTAELENLLNAFFDLIVAEVKEQFAIYHQKTPKKTEKTTNKNNSLQKMKEEALLQVGDRFQKEMVTYLGNMLDVKFTIIGQVVENGEKVQTIAIKAGHNIGENIQLKVSDSPYQLLIQDNFSDVVYYKDEVQKLFPHDTFLYEFNVNSLWGWPLKNSSGKTIGVLLFLNDKEIMNFQALETIIYKFCNRAAAELERKVAEQALIKSEAQYKGIFNSDSDAFIIFDSQGNIFNANQKACTMYGYTLEDFVKMKGVDLMHPDYQYMAKKFAIDIQSQGKFHAESLDVRADGTVFPIEVSGSSIQYNGMECTLAVIRDITQRKQAEELLKRYQALSEHARDIMLFLSIDGRILEANKAAGKAYGYTYEEMLSMRGQDLRIPELRHRFTEEFDKQIASKEGMLFETIHQRKDGSTFWVEISARSTNVGEEKIVLAIIRDITQRKKAEEQISKLNSAVEQSANSIIITDTAGIIEYVNPKFSKLTGYSAEEVIGKKPSLLKSGKQSDEYYEKLWITLKSGLEWHGRFCNLTKAGQIFWEQASISPIRDSTNIVTHYVAVKEDVTVLKQVEEELQEEKSFSESIIRNLHVPSFVLDAQHRVLIWNTACEELTGVAAQDVVGTTEHWRAFYQNHKQCVADIVIDGSNNRLPDSLIINQKYDELEAGMEAEGWLENLGGKNRYILVNADPIINSKGELVAVIETIQDYTDRKLLEEALLQKNEKVNKELQLAAEVQYDLLPHDLSMNKNVTFSWEFQPSVFVAGDMLNIFPINERYVAFFILDVRGHGIPAALKAVTLNNILKFSTLMTTNTSCEYLEDVEPVKPSEILEMLSERFGDEYHTGNFFTILYGLLNTKTYQVTFARAGHCLPLIITAEGECIEPKFGQPAIGLMQNPKFENYTLALNPGDKLFVYTDGIVEARNADQQSYSKKRMIEFIVQNRDKKISELIGELVLEVNTYIGGDEIDDDLTIIGIDMKSYV